MNDLVNMETNEKKAPDEGISSPAGYNGVTENNSLLQTDDPVIINDIASDRNAKIGEGEILPFDQVFPDHKAKEDTDEIQSTDDV